MKKKALGFLILIVVLAAVVTDSVIKLGILAAAISLAWFVIVFALIFLAIYLIGS